MKYFTVLFISLLGAQISFAQGTDTTTGTFIIRKPEGLVYTTGAYPSQLDTYEYDNLTNSFIISDLTVDNYSDGSGGMPVDMDYPAEAKERGISGIVYVSFEFDGNGRPANVVLARGFHPSLDKAALDYVTAMRPGDSGKPMPPKAGMRFTMPIIFSLN